MRRERINRIVAYSLSRIEAYLIVGLVFVAVIVAILGKWPGWVIGAIVVVGAVLLMLLIVDSLFDPNVERDASIADIDPSRLRDPVIGSKVRRALEYVRAMQKLARHDKGGALDAADDDLPDFEQSARSVYQMAVRLQEFRADGLLQRDITDLQAKQAQGSTLTADQVAQLHTLQRLDELVQSAEQEIETTLAHLSRSYAEMQAIKVTPEIRGHAVDALNNLKTSTKRLSDLADGYDEVFRGRAQAAGS